MILGIVVLVALVAAFWCLVTQANRSNSEGWAIVAALTCIMGIVHSFGLVVANADSYSDISALEAFSDSSRSSYEATFEETRSMTLSSSSQVGPTLLDAQRVEHLKIASERLKEYRDKVDWYNATLNKLRRRNENWFLAMYTAEVPEHLQPIKIDFNKK